MDRGALLRCRFKSRQCRSRDYIRRGHYIYSKGGCSPHCGGCQGRRDSTETGGGRSTRVPRIGRRCRVWRVVLRESACRELRCVDVGLGRSRRNGGSHRGGRRFNIAIVRRIQSLIVHRLNRSSLDLAYGIRTSVRRVAMWMARSSRCALVGGDGPRIDVWTEWGTGGRIPRQLRRWYDRCQSIISRVIVILLCVTLGFSDS